jgi:Domain of unknown function (DUF4395)
MPARSLFQFPNPINEVSTRLVAGVVAIACLIVLGLHLPLLLVPLAYGFIARAVAGPTLSPLAQLVNRVVIPRLRARVHPVPGPPKRFAQTMGAVFTTGAVLAYYGLGLHTVAYALTAVILVAATLESVFAYCLGCAVFNRLMRLGLIPQDVCEKCANLQLRNAH